MNPEDAEELEMLRRDVEALGGDPNAVLARAQNTPYVSRAPFYNDGQGTMTDQERGLGAGSSAQSRQPIQPGGQGAQAFRDVGAYGYEYKDPNAQGAAAGPQAGPMAQELRGLPGVVKPGPDGFDRVDPARLSLTNASATGELAREVEALRGEVAALGGSPDAVLSRVNKPRARQGRTAVADVGIGDVTTEADTGGYDRTTLEGAGQYDQDVLRTEQRQRKIRAGRDEYLRARENGYPLDPLPAPAPETTREYGGARQLEELDFDQRQEDELRAIAAYGITDAERQQNIRRVLDETQMEGDLSGVARYRPAAAGSVATDLNTGVRTGRTTGNISEDEVRRALQRREELYL